MNRDDYAMGVGSANVVDAGIEMKGIGNSLVPPINNQLWMTPNSLVPAMSIEVETGVTGD